MEIVIILIIIVVILYFFLKNKQSKTQNTQRENLLVNEMEALIFYGKNSQQEINTLAAKILSICLKRANKRITLAESYYRIFRRIASFSRKISVRH